MTAPVVSERATVGRPAWEAACTALGAGPLPRERVIRLLTVLDLPAPGLRSLVAHQ